MAQYWVDIQPGVLDDFTLLGDWDSPSDVTVVDVGGGEYEIEVDEQNQANPRSLIYDLVPDLADGDEMEVLVGLRVLLYRTGDDTTISLGPIAQQTIVDSTTADNELAAMSREDNGSGTVLYDRVNGSFSFDSDGDTHAQVDNQHYLRLRVNATDFQVREWEGSLGNEQASFEVTRSRPDIPSGVNGVKINRGGTYRITLLSFGTDGDAAPTEDPGGNVVSGTLAAQDSSITSTADLIAALSGSLAAQDSTFSSTAALEVAVSGSLQADDAAISGTLDAGTAISGALVAGESGLTGTLSADIALSGNLQADAATVAGTAAALIDLSGTLAADSASLSGTLGTGTQISGTLQADASTLTGASSVTAAVSGTLSAQEATVSAAADAIAALGGTLSADNSQVSGTLSESGLLISGALQADASTLSGSADLMAALSGVLAAQDSELSGTIARVSLRVETGGSRSAVVAIRRANKVVVH